VDQQLDLIKQLHAASPVPYAVVDNDFSVVWANECALKRYPQLTVAGGLGLLLSTSQLKALDNQTRAFSVPLSAVNNFAATFVPIENGFLVSFGFADTAQSSYLMPQSIDYVLGAISSRLRIPLSDIFAKVSSLARSYQIYDHPPLKELVEGINSSSYSILRFTADLTAYMRHILGSDQYYPEYINVSDFLRRFVTAVSVITESAGIPIISDIADSDAVILVDESALNHSLLHIISNCCRYTKEGNVIKISLETDNRSARITVSDKGLGIPAELLSKICEPFFSYDHFGEPMAGCGLGLAIAHHTITKSGGSFAVSSVLDEGTSVAVSLPIAEYNGDIPLKSAVPAADMLRDRFSLMHIILSDSCGNPKP